ncbi:MAG: ATP-dependent RecD-like DNA helicase [Clostridia bacterium]|nr:ATP-dependent RecD-like DNA helicase [Clostridia bacterium]
MSENEQTLSGIVERVVFHNEENGWTVLELAAEEELHKVVGVLPATHAGEQLKLTGSWVEHPKFGRQFRAQSCEHHLPTDTDAVFRYLASGAIKGIGPVTASALVQAFGEDTLRVIEEEPERLAKVKGITARRAGEIAKEYREQFGLREIILAFSGYGLTQSEALRCWKRWGASAVETIRANPYLLCSAGLYISFERADEIGKSMAHPQDATNRIEAGLLHVLRHNLGNGHTCLPSEKLVIAAAGLLQVEPTEVAAVLQDMVAGFSVREEVIKDRPFIFLPDLYQAEKYIASRIRLMTGVHTAISKNFGQRIAEIEKKNNIVYENQQKEAILAAVERGALILTGGPGTGKTTTLRAIITLLESLGERVEIAAPTGRAAKRMSELTGCEARTLHRLLEVQWDESDRPFFERNEKNPLDIDALIVDEVSMVDALLFESLLRALKGGCRLILVGDTDQLPAVGAGSILHDLIRSNALPVVQLTEVFRQALTSDIVAGAHRIVAGEMPEFSKKDGDFFFLPMPSAEETAQTVVDLCQRRLPAGYGTSLLQEIQVLCPGRKGVVGTVQLNAALQEAFNPPSTDKKEWQGAGTLFREGDKVMHIKNDYDIGWKRDDGTYGTGVFNGDIGILESISPRDLVLTVRYDDRVATYTYDQAQELELAYAITVHKSQGSEFHTVVLPLYRQPKQLCYRNLLYTAVTRAKTVLVMLGSRETVGSMVENNREMLRYTGLEHFVYQAERMFV